MGWVCRVLLASLNGTRSAGCHIGLLWLVAFLQTSASAEELYSPTSSANSRVWKIMAGSYLAQRDVNLHYQRKLDARSRVVDIGDPSSESEFRALPLFFIEYALSKDDFVDLEYVSTTVNTTAVARRTVNTLFFPLRLASKVTVAIETESIRLRYTRLLVRRDDWEMGGAIGIGRFAVRSEYPNGAGGVQADSFSSPLPDLGISGKYRWGQDVVLATRASYFPIYSRQNRGSVAGLNLALEYALDSKVLLGVGYRYSKVDIKLDKNTYRAEVSYVTQGPMVFVGAQF